jgi:hypothetical protein
MVKLQALSNPTHDIAPLLEKLDAQACEVVVICAKTFREKKRSSNALDIIQSMMKCEATSAKCLNFLRVAGFYLLYFVNETIAETLGSQAKRVFGDQRQSLSHANMAEELFIVV